MWTDDTDESTALESAAVRTGDTRCAAGGLVWTDDNSESTALESAAVCTDTGDPRRTADGLVWTDDNGEFTALESAAVRTDSLGAGDPRCTGFDWLFDVRTSDTTSLTTDAVFFSDTSDAV